MLSSEKLLILANQIRVYKCINWLSCCKMLFFLFDCYLCWRLKNGDLRLWQHLMICLLVTTTSCKIRWISNCKDIEYINWLSCCKMLFFLFDCYLCWRLKNGDLRLWQHLMICLLVTTTSCKIGWISNCKDICLCEA